MDNKLAIFTLLIVLITFGITYIMFKFPAITLSLIIGGFLFVRIYDTLNYKKNGGK